MQDDLELLCEELKSGLAGLDSQQTQLRPLQQPGKWSIQQIVGHLLMTYDSTGKALDSKIAKGRPTTAKLTLPQWAGQVVLLRCGYFPRGRTAPEIVSPPTDEAAASAELLIAHVSVALSALDLKLATAETVFGANTRSVTHFVLGPLRAKQWARFHLLHGRHHLKQIAALRKQHGI